MCIRDSGWADIYFIVCNSTVFLADETVIRWSSHSLCKEDDRKPDVYKRQFRDWLKSQPPEEVLNHAYEYTIREDIVMAMEELELTDTQAPVSYTHLDVYKRQVRCSILTVVVDMQAK